MQQMDDPPYLLVGTEVSAKYKGAFCEAKVSKVVRNIKIKVAYKQGLGSGVVSDDEIKAIPGQLRVGAIVEVRHPERKDFVEATITKVQDCSQYTVVFDDGDITTLRRTALCLKSGRHFNESETLDQLPLTHPEHFGNPVVGGRRGRRRGQLNDDSSDDGDESDTKEVVNEKEEHIGKVVCVETESKKKDKEKWFPALVVAPTAQATVRIRVKDEYLVRSFKDGRYYTVPKKEATEFTREAAAKQDGPAVQAALEYLDNEVLPPHWDRDSLFGLSNSSSDNEDEVDSDSSDDEPREEKDRFVAQLYKYMDDRGTPLNKVPSIQNRDVDLYRLFRAVQKRGGYNRVTAQNQWKSIAIRLGFTPVTVSITNLVKQAFKKFLQPYGEFHRKLGCSMLMSPRNSNRTKGRSLVRANSVASPKTVDSNKETVGGTSKLATSSYNVTTTSTTSNAQCIALPAVTTTIVTSIATTTASRVSTIVTTSGEAVNVAGSVMPTTSNVTDESEVTSESSQDANIKNTRRKSILGNHGTIVSNPGKVKSIIDKYEEKLAKDDGDVPLSKMKAAAALKEAIELKEKEKDSGGSKECSSGQVTRDSSPAGFSITGGKKEKHQRKQSFQNDDKRGKRKKDENIVEKIDTGDFIVETGDKLKVYYHEKRVTYEAKVIEIAVQRGTPMYLVHYTGWNNRYDEWVPRERIAENLTKGLKQKGRISINPNNEKCKENPSKSSMTAINTPMSGLTSGSSCNLSATMSTGKGVMGSGSGNGAKRGRGRSDSIPPRSSTPSSVASNSSRTKSPAASSAAKKRPQRQITNANRRVSIVSDISMLTEESETDSDEPVRRPARLIKANVYKKCPVKSKVSASAPNSQSDTDENDDDVDETMTTGKPVLQKGGTLDMNQVCSELKGLQSLKGTSDINVTLDKDGIPIKIKREKSDNDIKPSCITNIPNTIGKASIKMETKETVDKRLSTEGSSSTESFGDENSLSSEKIAEIKKMTKKMIRIIDMQNERELHKAVRIPSVPNKVNASFSGSKDNDVKPSCATNIPNTIGKASIKMETKEAVDKRLSTEASSGTESSGDEDSQSSDKTTQIKKMTKKMIRIIDMQNEMELHKALRIPSVSNKVNASFSGSKDNDIKPSCIANIPNTIGKASIKVDSKEEVDKRLSTEGSSCTESSGEEDSQSSDKTTQIKKMTKKMIRIIDMQNEMELHKAVRNPSVINKVNASFSGSKDNDVKPSCTTNIPNTIGKASIKMDTKEAVDKRLSTEGSSGTESSGDEDLQLSDKTTQIKKMTKKMIRIIDMQNEMELHKAVRNPSVINKVNASFSGSKGNDMKPSCATNISNTFGKASIKMDPNEAVDKRLSTEGSSGTKSFEDENSLSPDKIAEIKKMTKKMIRIIDMQNEMELHKAMRIPSRNKNKVNASFRGSKVVEKIIKDRENEKRQETLKVKKFPVKEESKIIGSNLPIKLEGNIKSEEDYSLKDEDKTSYPSSDIKVGIAPASRFGNTSSMPTTSKYTSVIVEKPLGISQKVETTSAYCKKLDTIKKVGQGSLSVCQFSRKFAEPSVHKEILKVELPAACSPSSISSNSSISSTNSSTSSATSTSRSLPDMSKLDISGSSSMGSGSTDSPPLYTNASKDTNSAKPISPDVYEFKDPEPFEFEMRKSSLAGSSSSATSVITTNLSNTSCSNLVPTSGLLRNKTLSKPEHYSTMPPNTILTSVNRKKRGSPMKEALKDSAIKHLKLDERSSSVMAAPILADAKLLHHSLIGSSSSSGALSNSNGKNSYNASSNKSLTGSIIMQTSCPSKSVSTHQGATSTVTNIVTTQKTELTAFDALRKSPNFNLNINALNEELAQTVQETTRALTDAMQGPLTPNSILSPEDESPKKLLPSASDSTENTPTQIPTVATFTSKIDTSTSVCSNTIEKSLSIKEDLSNVFGLSFGSGSTAKDSKFEFEDAKKLLSASVEAFDLDPTKFETKLTPSIADKVLKAISQKKEEEESKKQEAISREKDSTFLEDRKEKEHITILGSANNASNFVSKSVLKGIDEPKPLVTGVTLSTNTKVMSNEPLKINTELPGTTTSLMTGTLGSFLIGKRITPPLNSPDSKLGLLEAIGTKTQLTETIQKLECAIQRRTPVTSHNATPTTPLSITAPEAYSEESSDSTDSEQRLVIEDVIDESGATQIEEKNSPLLIRPEPTKFASSVTPVKLDTITTTLDKPIHHSQHDITTVTPIKLITPANSKVTLTSLATTSQSSDSSLNSSTRFPSKLNASTAGLIYQSNSNKITSSVVSTLPLTPPIIQNTQIILPTSMHQSLSSTPSTERMGTHLTGNNYSQHIIDTTSNNIPTTSMGVPIELPDIPASVVVASSAIPSVMAAAHAAAAALQTTKSSITTIKEVPSASTLSERPSMNLPSYGSTIYINSIRATLGQGTMTTTTTTTSQNQLINTSTAAFDNHSSSVNVHPISTSLRTHFNQLPTTTKAIYHSVPTIPETVSCTTSISTSGFYLDPQTELRPDDGLKPLTNETHQQRLDNEKLTVITHQHHSPASITAQSKEILTTQYGALDTCSNVINNDHHHNAINQLLCEETIPGSPASVITGREDSQERTAITGLIHDTINNNNANKDYSNMDTNLSSTTNMVPSTANSSPNDSASQEDESSEDLKKQEQEQENEEINTRKRRRSRKQQSDHMATLTGDHISLQQQHVQTKRKRSKKNNGGSDSDDNSDAVSQRSSAIQSSNKQQQSYLQQQQEHQMQASSAATTTTSKSCPYNFLVQLDPSLSPDQCIAILLKQIQDLRKTYNIIKSDLASIDRRRKKLRRREREKKQQQQQQQQQLQQHQLQQAKISS